MLQMVMARLPVDTCIGPAPVKLTCNDIPAMMDLVQITKPGPFGLRTNKLGAYVGICDGVRLVAMAGERMRLPG